MLLHVKIIYSIFQHKFSFVSLEYAEHNDRVVNLHSQADNWTELFKLLIPCIANWITYITITNNSIKSVM